MPDQKAEREQLGRLSIYLVTIVGLYLFCVSFLPVRPEATQLVYTITGMMGTALTGVLGYHYGSSKANKDKTDSMNTLMGKVPNAPEAINNNSEQLKKEEDG